ncbi:MAG: hypothetical protein EKK42_26550 [Pseudonocardiaceae bacterium]|nr:MAG: hypothetical protein EKK42_26550 [Pseudonocardiaceae bacterium]
MELLILSMLFAWGMVRYGATEFMAARSGTEAPRISERRQRAAHAHEMAMAKLSRRSTPTIAEAIGGRIADRIANPRGGPARKAAAEWWSDSWGYAVERRRRRHERAEAGELGRQRAARAARQWLRDRTGRGGQDQPQDPAGQQPGSHQNGQQRREQDEPEQQDPQRVWADAEVIRDDDEDIVDAEVVDEQPDPTPETDQRPTQPVDQVPTDRLDDDPTAPPPAGPDPTQAAPAALPLAALTAATAELHDIEASMASVTPIRGGMTMTAAQHTMTTGETLDPAAALAFIEGIRELAQRMFTEIELSVSTLSQAGVAGEPIALLQQMQEAAQVLVGNSETAKGHFERHVATQDTVLADDTLAGTVANTYVGTRS